MNSKFDDRLRIAAKKSCGTIRALADKSGVGERRIASWLAGTEPKINALADVARAANVSLDWLATGEGPMERGKNSGAENSDYGERIMEFVVRTIGEAEIKYDRIIPPDNKWQVIVHCRNMLEKTAETRKLLDQDPDNFEEDACIIYDIVAFTAKPLPDLQDD